MVLPRPLQGLGLGSEPQLKPRDGPVRTQIITKPDTTFTAYVTLGAPPPSSSTTFTTTTDMAPTYVTPAPESSATPGLSQAQIGGIICAVVGFVALTLVIWFCITTGNRRGRRARSVGSSYDSDTSGGSPSPTRRRRSDPWARRPPPPYYRSAQGPILERPPLRFPPPTRRTNYNQTSYPQIRGVRRFP